MLDNRKTPPGFPGGRAAAELGEARRLSDGYSSITQLKAGFYWVSKTRPLFENTYFAGLRKAGMPEE